MSSSEVNLISLSTRKQTAYKRLKASRLDLESDFQVTLSVQLSVANGVAIDALTFPTLCRLCDMTVDNQSRYGGRHSSSRVSWVRKDGYNHETEQSDQFDRVSQSVYLATHRRLARVVYGAT